MSNPFDFLNIMFDEGKENPDGRQTEMLFEARYDALEKEYLSVLGILKEHEGDTDPAALKQELEQSERNLTRILDAAQAEAGEIENRAQETMSGSDLQVMLRMIPSFMKVSGVSAAQEEVRKRRGLRLEELKKEMESRKTALDTGTAEQLERVMALLEGLTVSDEVTGMMGNIF